MIGMDSFRAGDRLTAGALNDRAAAIRAGQVTVDPDSGLEMTSTGRGTALHDARARPILGLLAGSGSPYTFTQAIDTGPGAIAVGKRVGKAYEVNGKAGLAGKTVRLFPDRSGNYRFQYTGRNGAPAGGGVVGITGCFCTSLPTSLAMTSCDTAANFRMFQPCSIVWGPPPGAYAALNLGARGGGNCYLSTASFPDPAAGGAIFQYYLTCTYAQFNLSRVYATHPSGSPYQDGVLFSWTTGGLNSCGTNSLVLSSGTAYPGSATTACVTIYGGAGPAPAGCFIGNSRVC